MRHVYYKVTIPAGEFVVRAEAGSFYQGMSYLDACGKMMMYRYFSPDELKVERIPAREAYGRTTVNSFDVIYKTYGHFN